MHDKMFIKIQFRYAKKVWKSDKVIYELSDENFEIQKYSVPFADYSLVMEEFYMTIINAKLITGYKDHYIKIKFLALPCIVQGSCRVGRNLTHAQWRVKIYAKYIRALLLINGYTQKKKNEVGPNNNNSLQKYESGNRKLKTKFNH